MNNPLSAKTLSSKIPPSQLANRGTCATDSSETSAESIGGSPPSPLSPDEAAFSRTQNQTIRTSCLADNDKGRRKLAHLQLALQIRDDSMLQLTRFAAFSGLHVSFPQTDAARLRQAGGTCIDTHL